MRQKSVGSKDAADKLVKNIRRKTAPRYSAEDDPEGWETVSPPPPPPPPQAAKVNITTNDTQNRTIKPMQHETKTTR